MHFRRTSRLPEFRKTIVQSQSCFEIIIIIKFNSLQFQILDG